MTPLSLSSGGRIRVVTLSDVFGDVQLAVPNDKVWRVKSIAYSVVTSGTANNKGLVVSIRPKSEEGGLVTAYYWRGHVGLVNGKTIIVTCAPGVSASDSNDDVKYIPIPEVSLPPGSSIEFDILNKETDNINALGSAVLLEEFDI